MKKTFDRVKILHINANGINEVVNDVSNLVIEAAASGVLFVSYEIDGHKKEIIGKGVTLRLTL